MNDVKGIQRFHAFEDIIDNSYHDLKVRFIFLRFDLFAENLTHRYELFGDDDVIKLMDLLDFFEKKRFEHEDRRV